MASEINRSGLRDWIVQRVTAIILGIYAIPLLLYLVIHNPTYSDWSALFHHLWMKIASFIVLLSVLWHAWIGLWTVLTDYVKPKFLRLTLEVLVMLFLIGSLLWFLEIVWGG